MQCEWICEVFWDDKFFGWTVEWNGIVLTWVDLGWELWKNLLEVFFSGIWRTVFSKYRQHSTEIFLKFTEK